MAGNIIPVAPGSATITATYGALTTTIPVTVAAAPPPSLPNPSGLAFLQDDFTSYTSTANFQTHISTIAGGTGGGSPILYSDGAAAQYAAIDQTITYNGHQTMQYQFPGGTDVNPKLWPNFDTPRSNIWFRAMIRFVPGFTTAGNGPGATGSEAYKLLGWAINTNLYDGSGRIEITNTTQYVCYWGASTKAGATVIDSDTGEASPGNITTEWQDGAWYQYILNYRVSGTTSFTDTYFGRNAVTPTHRSAGSAPNLDGLAAPPASGVQCGLNYNRIRSSSQAFQLNYGFWEVCDGVQYPNPYGVVLP